MKKFWLVLMVALAIAYHSVSNSNAAASVIGQGTLVREPNSSSSNTLRSVVVKAETLQDKVGKSLSYLEDPTKLLNVQDALEPAILARFVPSTVDIPNFGRTQSAYWFAAQVENSENTVQPLRLQVDYPGLSLLEIYLVSEKNEIEKFTRGWMHPVLAGFPRFDTLKFNADFNLEPSQRKLLLVRTESEFSTKLPLSIGPKDKLGDKNETERVILSMYLGVVFALFFYNLFLFLSSRQLGYFFYVAFVGCFHILLQSQICGLFYSLFGFVNPELMKKAVTVTSGLGARGTLCRSPAA